MANDILTTAQAAKLLGISIRTAQLLIEGGSLTSWKTPGGHRRVYRADIEALVAGPDPAASSALVVVVAAPGRLAGYEEALRGVGECLADGHDDVHTAAVAIGARMPAVVVVDLEDDDPERAALLRSLTANPALAGTRFLVVGGAGLASLRQLPDAVREVLRDQAPPPGTGDPAPPYPLAANENQRLAALDRSGLAQSPPEEAFDRLTWLAGRCLNAPVALLTLLTPTRQVFKSRQGLDMAETPRSWAFCNRTILQKGVFAVENLALDPEFRANPAVAGGPAFRFYAGAPVVDAGGFALGSLCVIDHVPRLLDEEQRRCLLTLAALASAEVQRQDAGRRLRQVLEAPNRRQGRVAGR